MREQGNAALARRAASASSNKPGDAQEHIKESIKLYSYAIDMALGRPTWEPAQIVRDELSVLLSNRSQGYIGLQAWPEAAVDAETSVEAKVAPGQGKAWWRRGRSLAEMGRVEEALEVVERGLEVGGEETAGGGGGGELRGLREEVLGKVRRKREKAGLR